MLSRESFRRAGIIATTLILVGGVVFFTIYNNNNKTVDGDEYKPIEVTEDTNNIKFSNRNRLIEIPLSKKVEFNESNPIYITIGQEVLPATIIDSKLLYIGDAPSEDNSITAVIQGITNIETVDKSNLEKSEEGYLLKYPTEGVSSIALNSDGGGYIPTVIEDKEFVMTVSETLYERSKEFTLTVRKDMEIDL